jgi:hypothetical protein
MRGASGDETGTRDAMAAVDRPRHVWSGLLVQTFNYKKPVTPAA